MLAAKTTRKSAAALPKELAVRPSQDDKPILPHRKHHHPNAKPNNKPSISQQLSIHKSQPGYQNTLEQRKTTASQDGERTGNPITFLAAIHERCCQNREARQGVWLIHSTTTQIRPNISKPVSIQHSARAAVHAVFLHNPSFCILHICM